MRIRHDSCPPQPDHAPNQRHDDATNLSSAYPNEVHVQTRWNSPAHTRGVNRRACGRGNGRPRPAALAPSLRLPSEDYPPRQRGSRENVPGASVCGAFTLGFLISFAWLNTACPCLNLPSAVAPTVRKLHAATRVYHRRGFRKEPGRALCLAERKAVRNSAALCPLRCPCR